MWDFFELRDRILEAERQEIQTAGLDAQELKRCEAVYDVLETIDDPKFFLESWANALYLNRWDYTPEVQELAQWLDKQTAEEVVKYFKARGVEV